MSFLNGFLLFGAVLAAVPVILHLLMRNKPKKLQFPALRLLQLRKRTNTRRMRLRHLWLLLLRILVILLAVLAVARPTLPAADYALTSREWWRLALVVLAGIGTYAAVKWFWKRSPRPGHVERYRTVLLRGGVGLGTLLLMLLFVLWPYGSRIAAEWTEPPTDVRENFPVSAALVFDVSPSMSYRHENRTRLDAAKGLARELAARLPPGSQVAVGDNAGDAAIVFQGDASALQARLDQLEIADLSLPLDRRVRAAIQLQVRDRERLQKQQPTAADAESLDGFLREIYVLTDLSAHAWQLSSARTLRDELEQHPWLSVYLVDVSHGAPQNISLLRPQLSGETVSRGAPVGVRIPLTVTGNASSKQQVEIAIRGPGGDFVKQGTKLVETSNAAQSFAEFTLPAVTPGLIEGEVRLPTSDPLAFDDTRYFTIEVIPPPRVLVISDERSRSLQWATFLEPDSLKREGRAKFSCEIHPPSVLERIDLSEFDVVCLLSVRQPSSAGWNKLETFVSEGKGLFVSLGSKQVDPLNYGGDSVSARKLLPGEPLAFLRFVPPEFLDLTGRTHPLLAAFDSVGGWGELSAASISYYWKVTPAEGASVVVPYTNADQHPALLERPLGRGRTILLTTSIVPGEWNDLAFARFEFMLLSHFIVERLNQTQNRALNLDVGETLSLPVPVSIHGTEYLLRTPGLKQVPVAADPDTSRLAPQMLDRAGHYGLRDRGGLFATGVSANLPLAESDLAPLTTEQLNELFGEGRFGVARSLEQLEPVVRDRRLGQEIVPFLALLLLFVFAAEQLTANLFYEPEGEPADAANPAAALGQLPQSTR